MKAAYAQWMNAWENRLAFSATNRIVRPFDWGLDWTAAWPVTPMYPRNGHGPEEYLKVLNQAALRHSAEFFAYRKPSAYALLDGSLHFESAVPTPCPENNTVQARWFPARHKPGSRRRAVIVLPHWNAQPHQHVALCQGLQRLGLSALRLTLPYHESRMPAGLERADYAVSSNVGRTIDATRQAVVDIRCCADWLESEGFESIGIVGTSLGSCYAFLASAHDPRLRVNVFNHCSTYFADVVWTGLSTRHIRQAMEGNISLDGLRECWMAISPVNYMSHFAALAKQCLFIYASYDTTFIPKLSQQTLDHVRSHNIDHKLVVLPCGHYTLGESPYKFIDGYHICSFLKRKL